MEGEQRKVSQDREREARPGGRETDEAKAERGKIQPFELDKEFMEQEASFRHHQGNLAEERELDPQQTVPGPLRNPEGTSLHGEQMPFRESTRHRS